MAWFILALCLIGALLLGGRVLLTADPKKLAKTIRIAGGTLLAVAALALLAFGRPMLAGLFGMGAMLAFGRPLAGGGLGGGLLGLLGQIFGGGAGRGSAWPGAGQGHGGGFGQGSGQGSGQGPRWHDAAGGAGNSSQVQTAWLRMTLEHDTGEMSGTVLRGRFRGRRLEVLQAGDLIVLLRECEVEDPDSVALLEAYLDRTVGPDWRRVHGGPGPGAGGGPGDGPGDGQRGDGGRARAGAGREEAEGPRRGRMSPQEARQILNLGADAGPDEVREAHRRLMKKLHPDHGGSNYLAGKINEAKDVLLGT